MLRSLRDESRMPSMSLEFARTNILSRSAGHSAVKAAAYRAGERLFDERIGLTVDYSHRADEVCHSQILLPDGADVALLDRTTLWSSVEDRENQHNRRASAQLAKDHILALPRELSPEDQTAMARAFAESEFVSKGLVVDLAIHDHSEGNPHAHLMTTTRRLEGSVFTDKARDLNGRFIGGQKMNEAAQLRHSWAAFQNAWFVKRGIDAQVHNHDGQDYAAEVHLGPAKAMGERGVETDLEAINAVIKDARTRAILDNPSIIIDRVAGRKSLFTRHDLYREAASRVSDAEAFQVLRTQLDAHPALLGIRSEQQGTTKEFLTTQAVLDLESAIRASGDRLGEEDSRFELDEAVVDQAIEARPVLSDEQRDAARHLVRSDRLGVVVGLAGAGKSTMLDAVRAAYQGAGHRVQGLALAGKAADELSHSAGIESRTIASWLMALENGRETIERGDVYVMDEAGMVDNRTMKHVLDRVELGGAKLIQVGDGEQLQSIRAGCPFRDLAKQNGFAEIATIRRQREDWMRQATKDLARGEAARAVTAYREAGFVHEASHEQSVEQIVADYLAAPEASKSILAHRNVDVQALNERIRAERIAAGELQSEQALRRGVAPEDVLGMPIDLEVGDRIRFDVDDAERGIAAGEHGTYLGESGGVHRVQNDDGVKASFTRGEYDGVRHLVDEDQFRQRFAAGDRVLFTKNDRSLGVKNGMLGELVEFQGSIARVRTDDGQMVEVDDKRYPHLAYGYATTIHKAQGMTVDRAFVFGSGTMDKHLGYVAMSRHRDRLDVYLPDEEFEHRSFTGVLSRTNRQASALDLAREHGLVDVSPPTPTAPVVMADKGVEELAELAVVVRAESVEPGQPAIDRAQLAVAFAAANALIDRVAAINLAQLNRDNQTTADWLQREVDTARAALAQHDALEPRQGFLASKAKHQVWENQRKPLARAVSNAEHDRAEHHEKAIAHPEANEVMTRNDAFLAYPKADEVQTLHRQLMSGDQNLAKLKRLEFDREQAVNAAAVSRIDRVASQVAKRLAASVEYQRALTDQDRQMIERVRGRGPEVGRGMEL